MVKVENFRCFLLSNSAKRDPISLSWANYLDNFANPEDELQAEHFHSFFKHMLSFDHWTKNQQYFHDHSKNLWNCFLESFPCRFEAPIVWPEQMQVLQISSPEEFLKVLDRHMSTNVSTGDRYKIVLTEKDQALAICKTNNGHLIVRQFFNKLLILNGQLRPLQENFFLEYDDQLKLVERVFFFGTYSNLIAKLDGSTRGRLLRGYTLQTYAQFEDKPLHLQKDFYYPLKKVESYFINKESDAFYIDIITEIERVSRLIRFGDQSGLNKAQVLIQKASQVLEQVYPNDKVLKLMIHNLNHQLENHREMREIETSCPIKDDLNLI